MAAGCLLPNLDRLGGGRAVGDDAGPDAAELDGATDASDGDAGCVNLLLNAGFEDKPTCEPWVNYGGPLGIADAAYSGAAACRACSSNVVNLSTALLGTTVPPGSRVAFSGRMRAQDGKMLAVQFNVAVEGQGKKFLLSTTYDAFRVETTLPEGGMSPQLRMNGDAHDGGCMLFDELTACVLPP